MTSKSMFRSVLLIAAAAVGLSATAAPAAVIYSTDFDGPADTTPADWTATTYLKLTGTGQYRHTAETAGDPGWDTFALSVYTGASLLNGTIEADFQRGGDNAGLVGRHQDNSNYYHIRLRSSTVDVYRFGLGGSGYLGSVSVPNFGDYPQDELWNISATFLGPNITTTLSDSAGEAVTTLSVYDNDNRFSDNRAGIRGRRGAIWENFTMTDDTPPTITITTADGVGADAYIENMTGTRRNNNYGGVNVVQLKNAGPDPTENNQYLSRKTYLRFDLDAIGPLETEIAWLELTASSSTGSEYAFDVYGLLDGHAGENWIETGSGSITWNNAPGNDPDSLGGVLGDDTVYLGQFSTAGHTPGQVLQFGSPELVDFLNADTDGQATLILTRFTHSDDYFDHSNAFYSKEGSLAAMGDYSLAPRLMVYAIPEPSAFVLSLFGVLFLACTRRGRRNGKG